MLRDRLYDIELEILHQNWCCLTQKLLPRFQVNINLELLSKYLLNYLKKRKKKKTQMTSAPFACIVTVSSPSALPMSFPK